MDGAQQEQWPETEVNGTATSGPYVPAGTKRIGEVNTNGHVTEKLTCIFRGTSIQNLKTEKIRGYNF